MSGAPIHPSGSKDDDDAATQELVRSARKILESGSAYEVVIALLRANGLEKGRSIFFLAKHLRMNLVEAKKLVHFSPVWADRRANDEAFHEQAWNALEEIAEDDDSIRLG